MSCSSDSTFQVGDKVVITSTFTDPAASDALVDPSVVTYKVKNPNGSTSTYTYGTDSEAAKTSTGIYTLKINITMAGVWKWRSYCTGNFQGAAQGSFEVEASEF
jgi:hypothetical protein